jgi:hypothetical protein
MRLFTVVKESPMLITVDSDARDESAVWWCIVRGGLDEFALAPRIAHPGPVADRVQVPRRLLIFRNITMLFQNRRYNKIALSGGRVRSIWRLRIQ